jgi:hypothetical protein
LIAIEAVTVCVDYGDFLAETIPWNISHFDKWVIVTHPHDHKTRELCRRWNLHCLLTEEIYRDGSEFNKGRAIIRGIDHLTSDGWVLHLDADIALPKTTRQVLDAAHLNPKAIYGADRVMVKGRDQWNKLKASGFLTNQHDYHCRINFPVGFEVGTRWANHHYGYCPIGFFQLWNAKTDLYKGIHTRPYPHRHGDAARGDVQHAIQWDRRDRHLLAELVVAHLESVKGSPLGVNWKGRVTPPL